MSWKIYLLARKRGDMCPLSSAGKKSNCVHKRRRLAQNSVLPPLEDPKENTTTKNTEGQLLIETISGCSTSTIVNHKDLFVNCKSSREVCIAMLRIHGLLFNEEEINTIECDSRGYYGEEKKMHTLKCKSCGTTGSSKKMLICDDCEEAYHMACSGVLTKNIPFGEEWYCHPCVRNKSKLTRNLNPRKKIYERNDSRRYKSSRIGKEYQVEVEEWTGPTYDDDDYFDNPSEIDPAEFIEVHNVKKHVNWLQCKSEIKKGTICGKWRRASFYELQSKNWDCSCAVQWDPIHADCAVPQELETSEVFKELERLKLLKQKIAEREKSRMNSNCKGSF